MDTLGGGDRIDNEVVYKAVIPPRERDRLREVALADLRREIELGLDDSPRGDVALLDVEEIKAKGRKRLAQKKN